MAKPKTADNQQARLAVDLYLDPKHIETLASIAPGTDSDVRKVTAIAMGLLEQLAEGGIMLPPVIVKKMEDSFGRAIEVENILDNFEKGIGRKDGRLGVTMFIDPAYEEPLRESAIFNGFNKPDGTPDVERYMQNLLDTAWDNGWFHQMTSGTRRLLMLPGDYDAVKELLGGKDFETGTDLAALLKEYCAQNSGLFSEPVEMT